jgi:hypothetical protein
LLTGIAVPVKKVKKIHLPQCLQFEEWFPIKTDHPSFSLLGSEERSKTFRRFGGDIRPIIRLSPSDFAIYRDDQVISSVFLKKVEL